MSMHNAGMTRKKESKDTGTLILAPSLKIETSGIQPLTMFKETWILANKFMTQEKLNSVQDLWPYILKYFYVLKVGTGEKKK